MKCMVTGAAGFIGSNLVEMLLVQGHHVTGFDNFSTGRREFLETALSSDRFRLVEGDLLDMDALTEATDGAEIVFHLAANADVRFGTQHPRRDLEQNTIATSNVLEAMRSCGVRRIAFSSTGSIYGEAEVVPTPENAPCPVQTSLYGASKIAAEGLISAYCEGYGIEGHIFRFVSILGERYTHGHVFDFYKQLQQHPDHLRILGNGKQRKSYLYVKDCIRAVLMAVANPSNKVNIYNLGVDSYCEVNDSVGWICAAMGVNPRLEYTGGDRGWIGDNPFIFLDTQKIRSIGWEPELTIRQGVERTIRYFEQHSWVLERS